MTQDSPFAKESAAPKSVLTCPACGLRLGDHDARCHGCGNDVRLWVRRGEQVWGPYDLARVREGYTQRRIVDSDEVAVGSGSWQAVGEVELKPPAVTQAPAPRVSTRITLRWAAVLVGVGLVVGAATGVWGWFVITSSRADMACRQNLEAIAAAVEAYRTEHGSYPAVDAHLPERLEPYLPAQKQWWTCPRTRKAYHVGSDTAGRPVVWDAPGKKGGPHRGMYHVAGPEGVKTSQQPPTGGTAVTGLSDSDENRAKVTKPTTSGVAQAQPSAPDAGK